MELTWFGLSCFRLSERGQATVITDPYNGHLGLPALKQKADIVTISHDAPGHNYEPAVSGHKYAITGPGEYEIGGVFITGVATPRKDPSEKRNIIYVFEFLDITVAHLGDLDKVPTQTQIDALGQVNILLIPVGGGNTLNASQASELISMIEPNIVVPMHYALEDLSLTLDPLDRFLKEMGITEAAPEPLLKLTKSSLPEETQIVVLAPKLK